MTAGHEAEMQTIIDRVAADAPPDTPPPRLMLDPQFADPHREKGRLDLSDVVAVVGPRRFRVGLENGTEVGCVAVMSALQDDVVDRTGRPWPEILGPDGAVIGVGGVSGRDRPVPALCGRSWGGCARSRFPPRRGGRLLSLSVSRWRVARPQHSSCLFLLQRRSSSNWLDRRRRC